MMRQRKIRIIVKPAPDGMAPVFGVVLPPTLGHWVGIHVTVKESGGQIILESGAKLGPLSREELNQKSKIIDKIKI